MDISRFAALEHGVLACREPRGFVASVPPAREALRARAIVAALALPFIARCAQERIGRDVDALASGAFLAKSALANPSAAVRLVREVCVRRHPQGHAVLALDLIAGIAAPSLAVRAGRCAYDVRALSCVTFDMTRPAWFP
jgi:hypothetical protein